MTGRTGSSPLLPHLRPRPDHPITFCVIGGGIYRYLFLYWINAIILVGVLTIILFAAVAAIVTSNAGLRIVSFASLSTLLFSTAAWF